MNILLINYMEITAPGGINKTVREIAKYMSTRGHYVTVLQANPLNLKNEENLDGFKVIRVGSKFENRLFGINHNIFLYLKNNLKFLNPDLIHVHGIHSLLSSEVIYAIRKVDINTPIVFSPHLDVSRSTFLGKYLWSIYVQIIGIKTFKKVNHILSCSTFEAQNISCIFDVNPSYISIIPHGVDIINLIKPHNSNTQINLIYAGYLIKRKSIHHVLNGLYSLIYDHNFNNVVLTIIGEGPERNRIADLVKNLNLEDHVIFKSFLPRSEYISELKRADIFLLLSASEAYGIAVAEALAQGTPCIVANNTALKEFTNEIGCYGIDYPPDPVNLSELILKIHSQDVKVGPLSEKIRTWDKVIDDYEKMYRKLSPLGKK